MLEIKQTALKEVIEIIPKRFGDQRGFFTESYNAERFKQAGILCDFVQDNHSYSAEAYVLRGLHLQNHPHAQDKLVRVLRGRIYDVAVDIRKGSPSFLQWVGVELSAERGNQLFVPIGFAHGFVTLEPDCEVAYKTSAYYSATDDRSIQFNDPAIGVNWPVDAKLVILSDKDRAAKPLSETDYNLIYQQD
jgi:dTDP-4-dehydrorhamnose 3,5-epimerase